MKGGVGVSRSQRIAARPDQRDEAAGHAFDDDGTPILFGDKQKLLSFRGADGSYETSALFELCEERAGKFRGGSRDDDRVEGCAIRKADAAVADVDIDVCMAEAAESGLSRGRERGLALDGVYMSSKFRQKRSLITRAGANFEDGVVGRQAKQFEHESNDVGLRDGLAFADGERVVVVGLIAVGRSDKLVARDLAHGGEHALVLDAALAQLRLDHMLAALGEVIAGHGESFACQKWGWQGVAELRSGGRDEASAPRWAVPPTECKPAARTSTGGDALTPQTLSYFLRWRTLTSKLTTPF